MRTVCCGQENSDKNKEPVTERTATGSIVFIRRKSYRLAALAPGSSAEQAFLNRLMGNGMFQVVDKNVFKGESGHLERWGAWALSCGLVAFQGWEVKGEDWVSHGCVSLGVLRREREVLVAVFALQDARMGDARAPCCGFYFFSDAISLVQHSTIRQHHWQKVEDEYQTGRGPIPHRVGDAFASWQQLVVQPTDAFPEHLPPATGVADFKAQAMDVVP